MRAAAVLLGSLALLAAGCRCADEPAPDHRRDAGRPSASIDTTAYLDGALLHARYDSSELAQWFSGLPRPTLGDSPLVAVFAGIVDELRGPTSDRLDAVGLRPDADIELSIRALDGRAASVRKLLGELVGDAEPDPALVERLRSESGTLGLHLRASLPFSDEAKLSAALVQILAGPETVAGEWAPICRTLTAALCTGRERVLVWARPGADRRVRIDAIYLFGSGASRTELEWIVAWADARASVASPFAGPSDGFEFELDGTSTLALIEAEALADATSRFLAGKLDYHAYLDQERALRDLVPEQRLFDGVGGRMRATDGAATLTLDWRPSERPAVAIADVFAPLTESYDLPTLDAACLDAPACARLAGLTMTRRFAPLALGPFADSTGAARVLRQAGDRGPILLMLASWPNLIGTAGQMAEADRGLMAEAEAALIREAYAVGGVMLELGEDEANDRWVGYLRVGPLALAAMRPLAALSGVGPRPIELEGVTASVDRGRYQAEDESTLVYLVDERERGSGGWLLAADADPSASWLLTRPREPASELTALGHLEIRELGRLAAREGVPFADDPPVQRWLAEHGLTVTLSRSDAGPSLRVELSDQSSATTSR